ncbi:nucleolin-like [Hordeum vulgare]|nr:nucleolin-like [Hordeum vulgare]
MDFNALLYHEFHMLCKLNDVCANMISLAMVEALQSLPSVVRIDQISTTFGLPTPGKSVIKSVLKATLLVREDQQCS